MFNNKILYKVAILSTLLLTFAILSDGGNLVQAQTPGGIITTPPGGIITTPPGGIGAPSNNVTALNVYDNSTMVLEFGNGTTLASPYSNVWTISFLPAGNQTLGNIPPGIGAVPPPGAGAVPPGGIGAVPPGGIGAVPPGGIGATTPPPGAVPPGGIGATTPPPGGAAVPPGIGTITTPTMIPS